MKVYISGPMRGQPAFGFAAFNRADAKVRAMGHTPLNPAKRDVDGGFDPVKLKLCGFEDLAQYGFSLRLALAKDCAMICADADAVLVLEGWELSKGAQAEVALARALGLPILQLREATDGHYFTEVLP